ncbi:MAG: hypothetical protein DWQ01_14910 [Planctomycetota bacterium]|nr:MAG: hypothetical protein DWQ01_14910 [Planctomycetota bacterium]
MEIIVHVGFGNVTLGMTKDELRHALGHPDIVDSAQEGLECWIYESLGINCDFHIEDEGRLSTVTFERPDWTLNGKIIIGKSNEHLLELKEEGILPDLKLTEKFDFWDACEYECEKLGITFWITEGQVDSLTMYPLFDSEGNRQFWPFG